jgi:hypothetical protein
MKRLVANSIKNLAGDGVTYTVTKEVKEGDQITLYLDNGFKYTLSITDYEWLKNQSSNVKPKNGFPPSFPYIGDLKAVSFREPIE